MTYQEAIHILMLSPLYFKLDLPDRKALVREFLAVHARYIKLRK